MGIKLIHNGINGFQKEFIRRLDQAILLKLHELGERLVTYAKDNHTYTDQTGNLTNSIGYAILRGKDMVSYSGTVNSEPTEKMLQTAKKIADGDNSTYTLIIVAGMNYAAYVEAKGYNVILPAKLKAKKDFPYEMGKIIKQVNSKFDKSWI